MIIGRLEIIWHRGDSETWNIIRWLDEGLITRPGWPEIYAIKAHRARYGSLMWEAKEAVEAVMDQRPGRWDPRP